MDDMIFRSDTVLSDVHLHTSGKRQLMVRLNAVGQPVFLTQFRLLLDKTRWTSEEEEGDVGRNALGCQERYREASSSPSRQDPSRSPGKEPDSSERIEALLDEDGDLEVVRRPRLACSEVEALPRDKVCPVILTTGGDPSEEHEQKHSSCDIVKIEHTMATPLEDVGKQVWRGAFLLADYLLCQQDLVKDCTVLELGGGTGLVSIAVAHTAKTVYCTDVGEDLLDMCERNISLNKHLTEAAGKGSKVKVRELDWLKNDFCTDPESVHSWSEDEIAELYDLTTVILAADVFYDDDLTDAFFRTLSRITSHLKNSCTVYLSIEKRLNFTLRHMDVVCEAYDHFRRSLDDLQNLREGRTRYTVEPVELSFPQRIVYGRVEQLELWKIRADKTSERSTYPCARLN
nr:methyltransferase-like protein 22 isoform X3 [Pogona vitticeps]XP_020664249.1 methyltransferase-like protein 22 isoform X3 [Pogona vitticeps]XP_020664250.1 methyltransferase-like protein 22 isoform X3 [Pogona vitticeps]